MRKILILFFLLLTGCSASFDEQAAIETATKFKEIQYNIIDYTDIDNQGEYERDLLKKLEPYLTKEEYNNFAANRSAGVAAFIAKNYKTNIYLEDITFEKNQEDKEKGMVGYRYTMTLKLSGEVNKTITEQGIMVLIQTEEGWKISYDMEEHTLLKNIEK